MPSALTYPGVYVEEIPSGVRTITGVATSITAFLGRALRGPTNTAITINSYGDFERIFGGLFADSTLGYAVRDFYLNGGSQAIIVRLYHPDPGTGAANPPLAKTKFTVGGVKLVAKYEGQWGAGLRASIDVDVLDAAASNLGLTKADVFNLTVWDSAPGGAKERFANVSFKNSPRRVDNVLEASSRLVQWDSPPKLDPGNPPAIAAATDLVTQSAQALADAKAAATPVPATITAAQTALTAALNAVAASDGLPLTYADDFAPNGALQKKSGLYALEQADLFNLLCIPPYMSTGTGADVEAALLSDAGAYCEKRRAMLLIDSPSKWSDKNKAKTGIDTDVGDPSKNAAIFFPRLRQPNPLHDSQVEEFAPCGAVAGVFARTDSGRGVWKAPAGLDATLVGVPELTVSLTDPENGELNPKGINCLRAMVPAGRIVWGSRTRQGDDRLASEWKYIPVRRTALFIEESLYRGTQWAVFEPNDEPLWAQLRLNVGVFMHELFRQGAFQGTSAKDAYFVKCDKETTTQADVNLGVVNLVVGFAPLKPAEFIVIQLQQIAGQLAT